MTGKADISDDARSVWKRAYLSLLYGGGVKTIQLQFDNSFSEAKAMINTFHRNWPAVRELQEGVKRAHAQRGFIRSLHGRHLHVEENGDHKLLNKLIQGSAADVMIAAILRVHRHLAANPRLESRMVSVIHDELILDGPERELPYLHNAIPNLMIDPTVHESVPIGVDHEVSTTNWAEKMSYEEWAVGPQKEEAV